GHQHGRDLTGRARVALGRMNRPLLVAHEDVADLFLVEERVVNRQDRSARIAENILYALVGQRLDHHFGARHLFHHRPLHLLIPEIKKGPRRAPARIADLAGGLPAPGDAPSYDYEANKVAHRSSTNSENCARTLPATRPSVKGQAARRRDRMDMAVSR